MSHGTNLEIAVFDQTRSALDRTGDLWGSLTGDPSMKVSGASDQVMVRGVPRHVVGYLKDFLFTEVQARAPVRSLSGGEKARLLLARLMAKPANLLILDEPTNDLDARRWTFCRTSWGSSTARLLLVSHDRDFIDRIATQTVALEGGGRASVYPGGWSDYAAQRPEAADEAPARAALPPRAPRPRKSPPGAARGLTFTERKRFDDLPALMERLQAEIGKLTEFLSQPDLYDREPVKFRKASEGLAERQAALAAAEEEWLLLAERA